MPRMTYFLSPGPRSWMDRPGMSPAMSMIPDAPALCSASPDSAWIDAGVSNTLVACCLLAVTTTSVSSALSAAGASAAAAALADIAVLADRILATVIAMIREPFLFGTIFVTPGCMALCQRLVVVIDTRIVAGTDHPHDIDAIRRGCLQRMRLLARQEDHIPRPDARLFVFRPHITLAAQHDDRLFVQVAMRGGLGRRYVADELSDEVGADALVHENLEITRSHRHALLRINRDDPLRAR